MGSELLTSSDDQGGGSDETESPLFICKMFDDLFPYYLSIGMTYEMYWLGDPELVRMYRKAEEIRAHRRNNELWQQGRYIYDTILRLTPSLNAFKPKEPLDYMDEPYPLTRKEYLEMMERKERKQMEEMRDKMLARAREINKKGDNRSE